MEIPNSTVPLATSDSNSQLSPSELSFSSPLSLKKTNSSPILSSLTHIYSNLRSNDKSDLQLTGGTKTNFLRKILSGSKSSDDLVTPESPPKRSVDEGFTYSCIDSLSPEADDLEIETDLQDLDLNTSFFKSMDNVRIPSVFLKEGLPLLKVSHKSRKRIYFKFDLSELKFIWKSALTSASLLAPTGRIAPALSKSKIYEFSIDDIRSLSYQQEASNYREELHVSKEFENQWLSVIYFDNKKRKLKTLHIVADTEHDFRKLQVLIETSKKLKEELMKNFLFDAEMKKNVLLSKAEDENNRNVKEVLTFNDILKYLRRLNININSNILKDAFTRISLSSAEASDGLNFEQFREFVSILKQRDDINTIFKDVCFPGRNYITLNDFKRFLMEVQLEHHPDDYIFKVFKKFSVASKDYWLQENFNNYLLSKYNSPLNYLDNDLSYFNYPLNEYYISSSHNTYLLGRQVAGDSSVEGYIKALQRGCRCVEIDIWDGNTEDLATGIATSEPMVCHGRTFTTEISFSNVIKTIKKHAFIISLYPLIISLEVNCSPSNQLKVVQILEEVLGDTLVREPIHVHDELPSPLQLRNRILVKAKKTSPFNDLVFSDNGNYVSASGTSTTTSISEDGGPAVSNRKNSFSIRGKNKSTKIVDELSNLGVYLQGLKFRNFSLPESKTYNHIFSLSEKSLNAMLKDEVKRGSVDKHNRKYFMRVYPSKMRLKSSNFMPITYWSQGVQMVATNWQTYDLGQQVNEAMFEAVNKKGYVLKPPSLRKPLLKGNKKFLSRNYKTRFRIQIISGHQLPKPKNSESAINPFISLEILASEVIWDQGSCIQKTSIIAENGFNPIWNATFSGLIIADHELVFLRFLVNTSNSAVEEFETNTIGILVVRLSDLNRGYRYFPINDLSGEELIYSSLFLRIDYEEE